MVFNNYFQALEFKKLSRVLLVSCSTDDIGIRKNLELVKGGRIIGYEDLGPDPAVVDLGGGPTETPASHVMVFMVTAINDYFKVPCAHFVITDKFKGQGTTNDSSFILSCV